MKTKKKPLILVTNDDGLYAKGLEASIEVAARFGYVCVVAPHSSSSGMSHAITIKYPLRANKVKEEEGLTVWVINGTPVDCIKLAINSLLPRLPDLVISGINHGPNSSISVIYSATMGSAIEACFYGIKAVGLSITDFSSDADFTAAKLYSKSIIRNVLKNGLPDGVCLNVNVPSLPLSDIKGVKICRQTKGIWKEEFDKRVDPRGNEYYWLTGNFKNFEPGANDTDEWALKNKFVSIVPVQIDMTAYSVIEILNKWNYEI